ncbi:HNH endonuclease [Promicromonospora sp. NPDC052451]|uniref:HNH endonuclease n=1 Tax=Promicromonospora sp. NPDC052451 TaxID=3364407 RepID=UPI0037CA86F0
MDATGARRGWLLMTSDGGTAYNDQLGIEYVYDSKVQNHKNVRPGDPIALWDGSVLLGISVVEDIAEVPATKTMLRCPTCGKTRLSSPSERRPVFRCPNCTAEFTVPRTDTVPVTRYTARYDAAWTSLDGLLRKTEIVSFVLKSGSFNSIRELDWPAFQQALTGTTAERAVQRVVSRTADLSWETPSEPRLELVGGFRHSLVRVRRGQQKFREHIFSSQGNVCAFTGAAPSRVLEAGHLYSYAQLGQHVEHGGLMLRRDIHRLFDDGLISVDPGRLRIDVAPELGEYPQYQRLHGRELEVSVRERQVEWLEKHWREHR